jgi:hypothetical protein
MEYRLIVIIQTKLTQYEKLGLEVSLKIRQFSSA